MMDLDNLKRTNDSFGHEWGDRYIHEAAACFLPQHSEDGTLCARVSGDEFTILFCGHESREEAGAARNRAGWWPAYETAGFDLPDGRGDAHPRFRRHCVVSGGRQRS